MSAGSAFSQDRVDLVALPSSFGTSDTAEERPGIGTLYPMKRRLKQSFSPQIGDLNTVFLRRRGLIQ